MKIAFDIKTELSDINTAKTSGTVTYRGETLELDCVISKRQTANYWFTDTTRVYDNTGHKRTVTPRLNNAIREEVKKQITEFISEDFVIASELNKNKNIGHMKSFIGKLQERIKQTEEAIAKAEAGQDSDEVIEKLRTSMRWHISP